MLGDPGRETRGGAIVHISSQLGHVSLIDRSVYSMTKHAVEGMNKTMATELATKGIRVNSVAPTWVETPMTGPALVDPASESLSCPASRWVIWRRCGILRAPWCFSARPRRR